MSNRPKRQVPSSAKVSAARQSGGGSTPVWVWIVVVAVVVVAGILAVVISSGGDDGKVTTASGDQVEALVYGEPTIEGDSLPTLPESGPDPAVGMAAPTVQGQSLGAESVSIADDGQPKVVMFLAHWCPHCQAEVPRITAWLEENGLPTDVELYAVATATDETKPNYPPGDWLSGEGWPVTTLVDDQDGTIASAYGLSGFPFFVAVDAEGNVVGRTSGELPVETFAQLIDSAAAGSTDALTGGAASPG